LLHLENNYRASVLIVLRLGLRLKVVWNLATGNLEQERPSLASVARISRSLSSTSGSLRVLHHGSALVDYPQGARRCTISCVVIIARLHWLLIQHSRGYGKVTWWRLHEIIGQVHQLRHTCG